MITIELKKITLDGIEYEVEFREPQVAVLLMSSEKDMLVGISSLMSAAIRNNKYINDAGDEDYEDSAISTYLDQWMEPWLLDNWELNIENEEVRN